MTTARLSEIVEAFKESRIAVVGDLILDVYVWGQATRISPEAPVPVVRVKERTQCLGGAANVMRNSVTLGGRVSAFGVIGSDANAVLMKELLDSYDIDHSGVFEDSKRRTTEKQRLIAGSQQLVRIDYEDVEDVSCKFRDMVTESLLGLIARKEIDAIIFEDYAKGMLDEEMLNMVTAAASKAGIITALDPNPGHMMKVSNLTVMKPNRPEAFGMAGIFCSDKVDPVEEDVPLMEVASKLITRWNPENLIISLGSQGMILFETHENFMVIPTKAREVFDVSGAGDTVISAFVLALTAGATSFEAAQIANHAAGIVVGKVGTVSVTKDELLQSFDSDRSP